jgi:hypothetical protein
MSDGSLSLSAAVMDENANPKPGTLTICQRNDDIEMCFFLTSGRKTRSRPLPDLFHHLLEFAGIEIDRKDRMHLTFSGQPLSVTYHFNSDSDIQSFFTFVAPKVRVSPHPSDPYQLVLRREGPLHSILDSDNNVFPEVTRPFLVDRPPPPPRALSLSDVTAMFQPEGQFSGNVYNCEIELAAFELLWPVLFNRDYASLKADKQADKETAHTVYATIKKQWQSTTRRQLANSPALLTLVTSLEDDLKSCASLFTGFTDPHAVQQIAFNVLLSVSFWDWDSALYVSGMLHLILPFLDTVIAAIENGIVRTPNGREIAIETAEAEVFWHFTTFFAGMRIGDTARPSNTPFVKPLFVEVRKALKEKYGDLLQRIGSRLDGVLKWLEDEMGLWFTRLFRGAEVRRLWASAALVRPEVFFHWFPIAVLLMVAPAKDFRSHPLDLNILLVNTEAMISKGEKSPVRPGQ